jgi:hypothetical protein
MRKYYRNLLLLLMVCVAGKAYAYDETVTWLYVKAKKNFNNTISVNWGMMAEPDDHRFEIERSENGQTFYTIATMPGRGANRGDNHYHTTDAHVRSGVIHYYRISLVGPDGVARYSPAVPLMWENDEGNLLVRLHPNPAPETLFIRFNNERARSGNIIILDSHGVTHFSGRVEQTSRQNTTLPVQVGKWPSGMYVLNFTTSYGDTQAVRFFVKH